MSSLSLGTLNVQAGGFANYSTEAVAPVRLSAIQTAVASMGVSVVGLIDTFRWREVYTSEELCELFGYAKAFHINMNCEVVDRRIGLTVLGDERIVRCEPVRIYDRDCLRVDLRFEGQLVCLYVVYLTSFSGERRRRQTAALLDYIRGRSETATLIMGDLNTLRPERLIWPGRLAASVLRWPPLAGLRAGRFTEVMELAHTDVVSLLRGNGFEDQLQGEPVATFRTQFLGLEVQFAVDYCFSRGLKLESCQVLRGEVYKEASDHYPVRVVI